MKDIINELIEKYQKEWDKHGMGSGISYSKLIADLEEASKQCNIANVVGQSEQLVCKCGLPKDKKGGSFNCMRTDCDMPIAN